MMIVALFIIANIIIACYFEKRRMRLSVIFHSVLFVEMLFCFAFYDTTNPISLLAQHWIGQEEYLKIFETISPSALGSGEGFFVSMMAFDASMLILEIFAFIICVNKVAEWIGVKQRSSFAKVGARQPEKLKAIVCTFTQKIYLLECRLLC